jgi:hypothetical protein
MNKKLETQLLFFSQKLSNGKKEQGIESVGFGRMAPRREPEGASANPAAHGDRNDRLVFRLRETDCKRDLQQQVLRMQPKEERGCVY